MHKPCSVFVLIICQLQRKICKLWPLSGLATDKSSNQYQTYKHQQATFKPFRDQAKSFGIQRQMSFLTFAKNCQPSVALLFYLSVFMSALISYHLFACHTRCCHPSDVELLVLTFLLSHISDCHSV